MGKIMQPAPRKPTPFAFGRIQEQLGRKGFWIGFFSGFAPKQATDLDGVEPLEQRKRKNYLKWLF